MAGLLLVSQLDLGVDLMGVKLSQALSSFELEGIVETCFSDSNIYVVSLEVDATVAASS